jgi:hypothetical protein
MCTQEITDNSFLYRNQNADKKEFKKFRDYGSIQKGSFEVEKIFTKFESGSIQPGYPIQIRHNRVSSIIA